MPLNLELDESIIGRNIRAIRQGAGLNISQLAERTGLSKALISRLENGRVSPSVATLLKIAKELQTPVSAFFDEASDHEGLVVVRQAERKPLVRMGTPFGYSYESLAYKKTDKAMEPFIVRYPPADSSAEMFDHEGEEFVFVLQGQLRLVYGDRTFYLEAGDSAYFDSATPHRGYSADEQECTVLSVVTTYRSGGDGNRKPK